MSRAERQALINRADPHLSIVRQCQLLKVARSTLYYQPAAVSDDDLAVMRRLDEQYLLTPFYGARRMVAVLRRDGFVVNRKRIRRLMRVMGIEAIYQKPNTSRRHPEHKVFRCRVGWLSGADPRRSCPAATTHSSRATEDAQPVDLLRHAQGEALAAPAFDKIRRRSRQDSVRRGCR